MKLKPRKKKKKVVEEVVEYEEIVAEERAASNGALSIADIEPDCAYTIWCYGKSQIPCEGRLILGSDLKKLWPQARDFYWVRYFGTSLKAQKGYSYLKIPSGEYLLVRAERGVTVESCIEPEPIRLKLKRKGYVANKRVRVTFRGS